MFAGLVVLSLEKNESFVYFLHQRTLTDYLESIDCPIEELYTEVRLTQTETTDPYLKMFIECLLASADYESFYKVMIKEGKKLKAVTMKKINDPKSPGRGWVSDDFKADDKLSGSSASPTYNRSSDSKLNDNVDEGKRSDSKYEEWSK